MDALLTLVGALIVLITLADVFFTVLFPASEHGPIRRPLEKGIWGAFRIFGRMISGRRRRNLLSYGGPVLITSTLAVWFGLLVLGGAMIHKPALGTGVQAVSGATDTSWSTAVYFSGYNLTTLGVGDVAPRTGPYRLVAIAQAAVGFTFFSMVITYFLSVYGNLTRRNAVALGLHHVTGKTDDAAEFLARLTDGEDLPEVRQHLSTLGEFLLQIHQTHHFYPVLRYFHYREPYYALPRILLTTLETVTLLRCALDEERYARVIRSPAVDGLFDAAMSLMLLLVPKEQGRAPSAAADVAWRARYLAARARLSTAGLRIRVDAEDGADDYVALRSQWDRPLRALAAAMLYEWEVIEQPSA